MATLSNAQVLNFGQGSRSVIPYHIIPCNCLRHASGLTMAKGRGGLVSHIAEGPVAPKGATMC